MTAIAQRKINAAIEIKILHDERRLVRYRLRVMPFFSKPDAEPYVSVGDSVQKGDVLCLVEAMKLMNEIQAPQSGVITEILVENEAIVEFNQPLFRIQ